MADQMSMKFGVDIIFLTGSCVIIPAPYSPGGANSSRTGESRWDLPPISSSIYFRLKLFNILSVA